MSSLRADAQMFEQNSNLSLRQDQLSQKDRDQIDILAERPESCPVRHQR